MPTNHDIKIISGNPSSGDLLIDPWDTVIVNRDDTVTWFITDEPTNVDLFKIKKKLFSRQIFSSSALPPSTPTNRGQGRVRNDAQDGSIYKYSIWWKPVKRSRWVEFDPKIAVNTSLHDRNWALYTAVALTAVGLSALFFLYTKRRKKKLPSKTFEAGPFDNNSVEES